MKRVFAALLGSLLFTVVACGSSGSDDSGSGGAAGCHPDTSGAGVSCGSATCGAAQVCVQPCCGGADTGVPCTPDPPFCVDASALDCSGCSSGSAPTQCSYMTGGCFSGNLSGKQLSCMCA